MESQSSHASNGNNDRSQAEDDALHDDRESVEEELREAKRQKQAMEDQQIAEYEEALEEDRRADEARYREYEAQCASSAAQTWEDWAMGSEIGKSGSSSSWLRVRMVAQLHGSEGQVLEQTTLQHDVPVGTPVTMTIGMQVQPTQESQTVHGSLVVPGSALRADDAASTMAASNASTTRVTSETAESGCVQGPAVEGRGSVEGPEGTLQGSEVKDVAAFLSSDEGSRAYHMWSRGVLSTDRARRMYGERVVDAFETHYVAAQQL